MVEERPALMCAPTISVVLPSYRREGVLVATVRSVLAQRGSGDEVIVVDQTPDHEPGTQAALEELSQRDGLRWVRKATPGICEAMNVGALVARGDILLFLDDDVVPTEGLLEAHRVAFTEPDAPPSACGQVLQPWNEGPVESIRDDAMGFDFAYSKRAEILPVMAGNFAVKRDVFIAAGGMDETFTGGAHRCDAEIGYRLAAFTGRRTRFVPEAGVRHLLSSGGTRAHGHKDTWAAIGSAMGDYYFGLRCLGRREALRHTLSRLSRAPLNRRTARRPWMVALLFVREIVALCRAVLRASGREQRYIRRLEDYRDVSGAGALSRSSSTSLAVDSRDSAPAET